MEESAPFFCWLQLPPEKAGSNCIKDRNGETRFTSEASFFLLICTLPLSLQNLCVHRTIMETGSSVDSLLSDLQEIWMYSSSPAYHHRACIVCKRFRCVFFLCPSSQWPYHTQILPYMMQDDTICPVLVDSSGSYKAVTDCSSPWRQHPKGPLVSHTISAKLGKISSCISLSSSLALNFFQFL